MNCCFLEEDTHGKKNDRERIIRKYNKWGGGFDFGLNFMVCVCVEI